MKTLKKHKVNNQNCCGQAYDVASVMSSDKKGGRTYIKDKQPKAESPHCRNYVPNLGIAHAWKNSSTQQFMASLTEAVNLLETSPKRQRYFEHFY